MIPNLPIKRFRSGEIIFNEGDEPDFVYVIISGSVEIFQDRNGAQTSIATLSDDDIFGDMALINHTPRTASARAISNISCYAVCLQEYQQKLNEASPMIQAILKILSRRLDAMIHPHNGPQ